ncbi:butyrophilin subfamily 1 member A1-like isoform X2 [Lagopus muta]|uniref:butyrophilin subfamily 1 member A1-like isoform X2 n=1 Tax=Lagopus muta TaxID=64668 RepID=UPI00209FF9BF|nr:butyrophilin subfamily 1 member A1-like isoform X2 [Lagopus muta]
MPTHGPTERLRLGGTVPSYNPPPVGPAGAHATHLVPTLSKDPNLALDPNLSPSLWHGGPQNLPLLLHPAASITLDPDTAHPDLVLSEDRKSVKRGAGQQDLPDNPERFAYWPFVLGHPSFSSGRHCWEVEVGDEGDWAIGVARESIPRKGQLSLCPKGGIWGVEKWGGQIRALTTHKVTLLALRWVPRRVSIHLDYAGGTVAFFDADEGGLIFVFSHASFAGEGVRPWLWVVGVRSQLRLCP